ncbi:MAG: NusG domain II-containing protein [Clostridia bacterium]|nr:NusG domain II-containing protein [Clostridia bacterium]
MLHTPMEIKLFRKGDIAVVALIIVAALVFAYTSISNADNLQAVITVDGEIVETVDLSSVKEKIVITPDTQPKVVIVAENGEIRFDSAECDDKLCVNTGSLKKGGDTAVCLPAKTVITVEGADVDAVVY